VDEVNAIEIERYYSNPSDSSTTLAKPAVPPLLPQIPTATFLADQTREAHNEAERARAEKAKAMMEFIRRKHCVSQPQSKSAGKENQTSESA
jgi:hypothetical protein